MTDGKCVYCGGPIYPERDWQMVEGWDKRRVAGGTNALVGRKVLGYWACDGCIAKIKRGQSPLQETIT